jgi:hypothetical protein
MKTGNARIGAWFSALFFGSFLGAWAFATLGALVEPRFSWKWLPYVGTVKWLVYMAVFTLVALTQALVLGAVDIVLLKAGVRMLPTGWRAWACAFFAPAAVGATLRIFPTVLGFAFAPWLLSALGVLLAVAIGMRLLFGEKIASPKVS